jgi:ectoine hydroxylase-related dioxygenase (phytanoyl-CoA dioxygenase family)
MLQVEVFDASRATEAAATFHRDGFVVVPNALTPDQLALAQSGANRVIKAQMEETELEKANRGFARYSFGEQTQHPEWRMLIDLPTTLPILEAIWGNGDFTCTGGGGDYCAPGAKIQPLHSDMEDFFHDPQNQTTSHDVPAPLIVINFLMVEFTKENGAIRIVPATQRSRSAPPKLAVEPEWMKNSILCAPAGTAVIRDVRCWHAGTANNSQQIRPMSAIGYFAPWFRTPAPHMDPAVFETLSPRAQQLCRFIVATSARSTIRTRLWPWRRRAPASTP